MNEQIKTLEHGAYGLLAVTGVGTSSLKFIGFLNDNAGALGVIMTFVFGTVGVGLTIYANTRKSQTGQDNKEEIQALKKEISLIGSRKSDK